MPFVDEMMAQEVIGEGKPNNGNRLPRLPPETPLFWQVKLEWHLLNILIMKELCHGREIIYIDVLITECAL